MNTYQEYEQAVFDWLMAKHGKDSNFTFSLRQMANKGAERDYFIGTEKSRYFATTFWYIPVAYPGNASELISVIFKLPETGYSYTFQFLQTKKPHNDQNRAGLKLLEKVKPIVKEHFSNFYESKEENKMESFGFNSLKSVYNSIDEMLMDFGSQLEKVLPIVDKGIEDLKKQYSGFEAHRYTVNEFNNMLAKLDARKSRYKTADQKLETVNGAEEETADNHENRNSIQQPLNQILYGPPGTGKTYTTINKAVKTASPLFDFTNKNRDEIKKEYLKCVKDGQIKFATFHQSLSYEDFIEGIKPLKPLPLETYVKYDVQDGIFKKLCADAKSNYENSKVENKSKLSFEDAFELFKEEWEAKPDMKFPLKTEGYEFTIIGFTNTSIQFRKASGGTSHTLSIKTLEDQYYGKQFNFQQGVGIYYPSVLKKIQSYGENRRTEVKLKSFVLIIDEINRGKVSQIFGELITLIEEDKRIGKKEEIEVVLPYSKENFSVPPNLYIVGTMNTADRSVEALDTALRRRFSFEEMEARPELLSSKRKLWELLWEYKNFDWEEEPYKSKENDLFELLGVDDENADRIEEIWEKIKKEKVKREGQIDYFNTIAFTGIDLEIMLKVINIRLEKLLDKDQQIGHAFFMNILSKEELYQAFYQKIIPQLQEYFYGDFGKIGLILGKAIY